MMRFNMPLGHFIGALLFFAAPLATIDAQVDAVVLFNGQDLSGWKTKTGSPDETLKVGTATLSADDSSELEVDSEGNELINFKGGAVDFFSEAQFGDALIEVEFMVPKGSNSGIYVMGEYEVQVFDSFGKDEVGTSDLGGLYGAQAPRVNAAKAPGEWQRFVIDFRAPRFDRNGDKTENARFVKVTLNDQLIHENVEMQGPTPGGLTGKESLQGPLMFQGDHGPVAYRHIKVTPVK